MKRRAKQSLAFKTSHTTREIIQFISDPDSPPLQTSTLLTIPDWYNRCKVAWTATNIVATLTSVGAMVWLSYPEYIDNDGITEINLLNGVELVANSLFVGDYVVRFTVTDVGKLWFFLDPANIVDLLSTLPFFLGLILAAVFNVRADWLRILFLFRAIRIIRLGRYHPGVALMFSTMKKSADLLALIVLVVMISMLFVSTAFFFAERRRFDDVQGVWMRACPPHIAAVNASCVEQIAPYQSIPESMYWSLVVMTTVGHSIDAPTTQLGRAIASFTSICGVFFFAAPATVLATNYVILRTKEAEAKKARKMDQRQTVAMKAQESLRRDLERAYKTKNQKGTAKIVTKRTLTPATTFEYEGVARTIFEVIPESYYVYEPILGFVRNDDGEIDWTDDFNLSTAQRVLCLHIVADCEEARAEARAALVRIGAIDAETSEETCLVCADPESDLLVQHDFQCSYPRLEEVVQLNSLRTNQVYMSDACPVRFVIAMPHMYPAADVIDLLKETRLTVSLGLRKEILEMHVPLSIDNLMASRLIRELYEIAYCRPEDGNFIAYIHPSDADMLLEGFCDQFIPTPSPRHIVIDPYVVDQQVLMALKTSFPMVRVDWIPAEAANAYFRGPHMSIGNDADEEMLLEVNLTTLQAFDQLGFGQRFRLQVALTQTIRANHQFQLV